MTGSSLKTMVFRKRPKRCWHSSTNSRSIPWRFKLRSTTRIRHLQVKSSTSEVVMAESLSAEYDRRHFLQTMVAGAAIPLLRPAQAQEASVLMKVIPSTQERIPAVGLGSWITFNVGKDVLLRDECAAVMAAFFDSGGRLIDSSPMYG